MSNFYSIRDFLNEFLNVQEFSFSDIRSLVKRDLQTIQKGTSMGVSSYVSNVPRAMKTERIEEKGHRLK